MSAFPEEYLSGNISQNHEISLTHTTLLALVNRAAGKALCVFYHVCSRVAKRCASIVPKGHDPNVSYTSRENALKLEGMRLVICLGVSSDLR